MKFLFFVSLALVSTLVVSAQHLPEVLIHRAREMIDIAEKELHQHHLEGRHHLTKALEKEIESVRELEQELLGLEQHKHLELHHVHEVEERLLRHENRLMEELVTIIHLHQKERNQHENREHEHREHESD